MAERIYLDHNATTPIRPEAAAAVTAALCLTGNPSSPHAEGRAARKLVEEARVAVAALVGADARNVTFTSGATEALNLALAPDLRIGGAPFGRLIVFAAEHQAVLAGHRFPASAVDIVSARADGRIDLSALDRALAASPGRPLVALQAANNETGVIQPVAEAAARVHVAGGAIVVDASQAAGKVPLSMGDLGADIVVLSGHKLGAPSGVGALVRARADVHVPALVRGGGQEQGVRGGTENFCGIAGFSAAAGAARRDLDGFGERAALRDRLEAGLRALDTRTVIFGVDVPRLANTTLFAVPGIAAETALIALDLAGAAVSSGSACSSGKMKRSHVLDAMGVPHDISDGALRVSSGWTTKDADIDRFLEIWAGVLAGFLRGVERERAA